MTKVIRDAGKDVSLEVAKELILLASSEITKSKVFYHEYFLKGKEGLRLQPARQADFH